MKGELSHAQLAQELRRIDEAIEHILSSEELAKRELDRRLSEEHAAIATFFSAVEDAKARGEWRNVHYNIFDVLGRPRLEEAHSRFVAWLLDPNAAHGLGDKFLRQFMQRAVGKEPPSTLDVTVEFEKEFDGGRRFDIYVAGEGWCLVIENKIDDEPWENQRKRLQPYCNRQRTIGKTAWLAYLTRNGRSLKRPTHSISYSTVGDILDTLQPDAAAELVIRHFRDHILSDLGA